MNSPSLNKVFAEWLVTSTGCALPETVLAATKKRIADVVGLMYAGSSLAFGRKVYSAVAADGGGASTVVGLEATATAETAALVNGACAHVLEFDDTHLETAVHVSSPVVAAALAVAEAVGASGKDLLHAVAVANELSCRVGLVSPGAFHSAGYHPTAIVGAFGAVYAVARVKRLQPSVIRHAIGIVASQSAGLMAAWVDGTEAKSLHPGWSAHCGIMSVKLAEAGLTGPDLAYEGPYGIFRTHIKDPKFPLDFSRPKNNLGVRWESDAIAFKPFPAGHFVHAFVDAVLHVIIEHDIVPERIREIHCPIARHMVQMICEPIEQKIAPASSWHCRVSLQWSLAEAAVLRRLDRHAYDLARPEVSTTRDLAKKVTYRIDDELSDRSVWQGRVIVTLTDGTVIEHTERFNRGSVQNPLTDRDLYAKFSSNLEGSMSPKRTKALYDHLMALEQVSDMRHFFNTLAPLDSE